MSSRLAGKRRRSGTGGTWNSWLRWLGARGSETAGFFAKFLLLAIPLYLLIYFRADFRLAQEATAAQVAFFTRLLGIPAVADGYLVRGGNIILEIVEACVAWKDVFAFVALVLAVPGRSLRSRALGIAAGSLAIYAFNIGRLMSILIVGAHWPEAVGIVHSVMWKFGMVSLLLLLWFGWLAATREGSSPGSQPINIRRSGR